MTQNYEALHKAQAIGTFLIIKLDDGSAMLVTVKAYIVS